MQAFSFMMSQNNPPLGTLHPNIPNPINTAPLISFS